ncbi:MAG TPA: ATP-binding protein [Myxococcales bacterium]|nr:ATP-binding protein [Myxococcales bacterium]
MLLWWGPQLIQVYNDAFRPSFGQGKHPSAMGQPARECWPEVWPVVGQELENVVAKGDAIWNEDTLVPVFRDGRVDDAWWTYSYSPVFDDDGARAGVLIVCTETTAAIVARRELERAKKEAELAREELRSVFMQAPMPIAILTGPRHRFTLANPAYEALVSRAVLGKTLMEAFAEEEAGDYRGILDRVLRTGEAVSIREAELHLANAQGVLETRYIDFLYHAYRSPEGSILGVMALVNDVTAAVAARREIERAGKERLAVLEREQSLRVAAEAGGRARDEFLAMLGHELRNPLAPISTATTLMRMNGDHHPRERQIIERQVAHLSRLVDDLLDVARIARGKIHLELAPVELAEVVAKAIETASPLLEQRVHQLSVNVPRKGLIVEGDPVRLAQVVGNLLSNAARYTQPGGRIGIHAARSGALLTLTVVDNGPGISQELLPRIFDLFVQGHRRIDRAEGGLGLGLALVKNLVALHGGSVSARNVPGGGSEFSISLPALGPDAAARSIEARTAEAPPISSASVRRRVLVVDDNEDAADLLSEFLRGVGHDVVIAHDGPQALEVLRSFPAEIGLLDLGLPGMDGFELARRIREQGGSSVRHLVALTGYGQEHDRNASRSAGFDRHLTKPVDLEHLAAIIEEKA